MSEEGVPTSSGIGGRRSLAAAHHNTAAEHPEQAAKHHTETEKYHENDEHEAAAHRADATAGHVADAKDHANEAATLCCAVAQAGIWFRMILVWPLVFVTGGKPA